MDNKELDVLNNAETGDETVTLNEVDNSTNQVEETVVENKESVVGNVTTESTFSDDVQGSSFDNNLETSNEDTSNKYNMTLLLNYFLGGLGLHRIINGRKASGGAMLIATVLVLPIFYILLWLGLSKESTILIVVGLLASPIALAVSITVLIDFIMILCGKFKNKDKVEIKSNKPFFKNWVHYLVIAWLVISMISSIVFGVFYSGSILDSFDNSKDKEVVEKDKDEDEEKKSTDAAFEKSMEAYENCFNGEEDDITFEDFDEFIDPIEEHFEDLGYEFDSNDGLLHITKETDEEEYGVVIRLGEIKGVTYISTCSIKYDVLEDDVYTGVEYRQSTAYPNEELVYDISLRKYEDGDRYSFYGSYNTDKDEYELSEIYTEEEYDFEKDEKKLKEKFSGLISDLEDEQKDILDY